MRHCPEGKVAPDESPNHLASTLRRWRERNGWPLKKVADEFGVTPATWSRWENGERFPAHQFILPLAHYLEVPICRFFSLVDARCPFCRIDGRPPAKTAPPP
jgi:transcriptional regulator with XRE-family HTH domain